MNLVDDVRVNNPVVQSAELVAARSRFVKLNKHELARFSHTLDTRHLQPWLDLAPVDLSALESHERLNFLLLLTSLSFRYWGNPKWTVEYNGKSYDGAWGLVVALWKAVETGILPLNPKSWAEFDEQRAAEILTGNVLIPKFRDRLAIIRELAQILGRKYEYSFERFLKATRGDAVEVVLAIATEFPSFRDVSTLDGHTVFFLKRAQLLLADIARMCPELVSRDARDISQLSACADYKLPWILRKSNILEYADSLSERIDAGVEILSGSREEIEIRANTIWALELITRTLRTKKSTIMTIQVNDHLWLQAQEKFPDDPPYHLTDTIFY